MSGSLNLSSMDGDGFKPFHITTPLLESKPFSERLGLPVYLKCENCQPSGSFKLRGIGHFILTKYRSGIRNFVTASGGNAGLATAYCAQKLGANSTICIPESSPTTVIEKLKSLGANVIIHGEAWDEANKESLRIASQPGSVHVHPFDHPLVWEGHTTMITEIREQLGEVKPSCVVVAVGGGGLFIGIVQGLKLCGWDDVPVIAMETVGAASFNGAVKAGKLITLPKITSIAICLGAKTVSQRALDYVVKQEHPIYSYTVTDKEALDACSQFVDDHRFLVQPACGAGLASVYSGILLRARNEGIIRGSGPAIVIVCGGALVTLELLSKWKTQVGNI